LQGALAKVAGEGGAPQPLDGGCGTAEHFIELAQDVQSAMNASDTVRQNSEGNRTNMLDIVGREDKLGWDVKKWRDDYNDLSEAVRVGARLDTPCRDRYQLALKVRGDTDTAINQLTQIKALAQQVGKPFLLTTYSISRTEIQKFTIHIEKNGKWPADLDPKRFVDDERESSIAPYEAVPVRLVPSMVYSLVDERTYAAKPSGDKFVVTETKKEVTGLDLSAALEFSPKALDFTTFNGVVQFGVSPQKNIGLFLGAGINVPSVFTFGVGVTYQQVDRLGAGLTPNQTIDKADALKTSKKFASGLYIFITIPKKK